MYKSGLCLMGSSVVCLVALILFQKLRGLLVFAASSLACNSAVALRFFCLVRALYSLFTLQMLGCSQGVFERAWLKA